jgi:hypothetical protein
LSADQAFSGLSAGPDPRKYFVSGTNFNNYYNVLPTGSNNLYNGNSNNNYLYNNIVSPPQAERKEGLVYDYSPLLSQTGSDSFMTFFSKRGLKASFAFALFKVLSSEANASSNWQ